MALTKEQIAQQQKQAEELLFSGPQTLGFAKGLFFGHFNSPLLFPYPVLKPDQQAEVDRAVREVREYCDQHIDAARIDRDAEIPQDVIDGLARVGVLGMTAPKEMGGRGFSQQQYCKVMEVIGGHDAGVAVFVNAHHSIGIRALLLFGNEEQKRKWLPRMMTGEDLAAFALTEPQAGSDAANVQTTATPTPDGKGYLLNGEKYYITNGGIAKVLTVMARTPVAGSTETKVTAFIVTPDMPGFTVKEKRMPKVGIRGTATGWMLFKDVFVPKENILGQVGKGLRVALTVLDFGRTTFGASCTGAAKYCLKAAVRYAKKRVQFKQPLAEFELVKKKIAYMAACAFAMEATVAECASFIDRGFEDFMLETAMLKVWSTDALWTIVNDTIQIHGGKAYFTDEPFERMMRDARINQIGEGANDVLRAFIALVGMRGVGEQFKGVLSSWQGVLRDPMKEVPALAKFGASQFGNLFTVPDVPVKSRELRPLARRLGRRVHDFGQAVQRMLMTHREKILTMQYQQERLADAACELYASACTLARMDHLQTYGNGNPDEVRRDLVAGRYFLTLSNRRIRQCLGSLADNDDALTTAAADAALERG